MPGIRSANRRTNRRDFVLGLKSGDPKFLQLRQTMQDRRSWRNRITAKKQRQFGQLRARHQPKADRVGPGDGAIKAGIALHRIDVDLLDMATDLGGLAIGVPSVQRGDIGLGQQRVLGKLAVQPVDQRRAVAVKHPQRQPQRPHILAAQRFLVAKAKGLHRFQRQRGNIKRQQLPLGKRAILQRIGLVFGLLEVALGELAAVGDDQATGLQRLHVHFQPGRVHRHQHIGGVASGSNFGAAEIDLKRRHAKQRALRRADFGGEIGEGRKIIASERG